MSYKNMKARKRFMAIALSGAMMLSVTGCGSTATGDVQTLENPEIMSKSDEELSDVLENSIGLSENTDSDKDETVYVIADAAGNKQDVIVSEWLKNTDGEATIKDSSNLTDIENVKGDETFTENNGELVWKADGNSIYYQGKSEEQVPVEVKVKKNTVIVDTDEGPRPGTTAESISKLRPAFKKDGIVTAANSSGINDGAACVVVMSEEKAKELGVTPMATWVAGALGGVDPSIMGVGPVASTKKVLAKTGMSIDDFDLIEANEAFAAQSLAVGRELGINPEKLNVNGGAIALGHPVGASGCRILVTLLHEMQKRDAKKGLATLCIGGGMGCSTIVERD